MEGRPLWFGACSLALVAGCGRFDFDPVAGNPDGSMTGADADPTIARVTIVREGNGGGTVVGGGLDCGTTCTIDVVPGTAISLRGLATTGSWFAGWSGPCGGNFDCDFVADRDFTVTADFSPRPNRVFVTSTSVDGAFGGIIAGDAMCGMRAMAGGLDGTWIAYLSDGATDAIDRLAGSRGWIRVDGAPVADVPAELASGPLIFPPRMDEYGNDTLSDAVYTGTDNGVSSPDNCTGWSTNLPGVDGGVVWTHWGSTFASWSSIDTCDSNGRLFCVEIGKNVPVASKPDTGRLAFITQNPWRPGGGLASADALCAMEAAAAQTPGSFLAALATTTATIASRFAPGLPWRRADGVRVTRGSTMFVSSYLDVAFERDLGDQVVVDDFWSGAMRFNVVAEANGNCNDWTVGDATSMGDMHFTSDTWVGDPAKREPCDWDVPILCLEQ